MLSFLVSSALAGGSAGVAVLTVGGAGDDCCAQKIAAALDALPFVEGAAVSWEKGQACARLTGPFDGAAVGAALTNAGYQLGSYQLAPACPEGLAIAEMDPWGGVTGIDLVHVSKGERFELTKVLAPGKFTIVDFGATWCGPCHTAADRIEAYVRTHPDVAVRAVLLTGADAKASFAQPVAAQHLGFAEGLPWFLVYGPDGKPLYKGSDLGALFSAIDRKRS